MSEDMVPDDLTFVLDTEPGIRHEKMRRVLLRTQGEQLKDAAALAYIKGVAIPPAWTHMRIWPGREGHQQTTVLRLLD